MGVIKNEVGRPSNKTLMVRSILRFLGVVVIAGTMVWISYNLKDNKETKPEVKENKEEVVYFYKDLIGVYETEDKINKLVLYEDGTYADICVGCENHEAYYGNYILEDNKLILNQMFFNGSDIALYKKEARLEVKIFDEDKITLKSITYKKKSSDLSKEYESLIKSIDNLIKSYE